MDKVSKAYIFTDSLLISVSEILCNSKIHVLNDTFIELKHFVYMNKVYLYFYISTKRLSFHIELPRYSVSQIA